MNDPLISIVIPTFNQAEFLEETVKSVLEQNYRRFELIVVNDGSTDRTSDILRKYSNYIQQIDQQNKGQAAALNAGWKLSRGKLLGYISSDDILENSALEVLVSAWKKNPDAVVIYPDYKIINRTGRIIKIVRTPDYKESLLRRDLICPIGPGALFDRDIFDRRGGWDVRLRQIPDVEFWFRASELGQFIRVKESLARSRIHSGSTTYREMSFRRSIEIISVVERNTRLYRTPTDLNLARSIAFMIAGRNNLQSTRYALGTKFLLKALITYPRLLFKWRFYRTSIQGFRLFIFRLLGRFD